MLSSPTRKSCGFPRPAAMKGQAAAPRPIPFHKGVSPSEDFSSLAGHHGTLQATSHPHNTGVTPAKGNNAAPHGSNMTLGKSAASARRV
ncbi:hypothetical protein E2C01_050820 [Portunus trituberculatus]|uniref:Uncharacterized protein n=1 Tax=Portunus trituberculatus TaxID=210409 RepID=A0A5B7GK00_PORTR|nr:hypothetical protein [Portunus trituberculatus]